MEPFRNHQNGSFKLLDLSSVFCIVLTLQCLWLVGGLAAHCHPPPPTAQGLTGWSWVAVLESASPSPICWPRRGSSLQPAGAGGDEHRRASALGLTGVLPRVNTARGPCRKEARLVLRIPIALLSLCPADPKLLDLLPTLKLLLTLKMSGRWCYSCNPEMHPAQPFEVPG